jgi:hypothetical protein
MNTMPTRSPESCNSRRARCAVLPWVSSTSQESRAELHRALGGLFRQGLVCALLLRAAREDAADQLEPWNVAEELLGDLRGPIGAASVG